MRDVGPCTTLGEANEQLRADMRIMYWSLSLGLRVETVKDANGNEVERELVVHQEPEFVGPRQEGVPRLMRVSDFAELMGWAVGPRHSNICNGRMSRRKFKNRK